MPLTGPDPRPASAPDPAAEPFDLEPFDRRMDAASAAPVAVAYSGGGDSLALLLAAAAWAQQAGRPLLALHVDHGLQPDSAAWSAAAERTARGLGADFGLLRWEGEKPAAGLAAAARSARLRLLAEAARQAGARVLLLGHTADDVLEGEVMRAEGSNLGRLREWSPSPMWPEGRGIFHFRPLLDVRRAALRRRLIELGRTWIEDPANQDVRYARTRARRALALDPPAEPPASAEPDPALAALAGAAQIDAAGAISVGRDRLRSADQATVRAFVRQALLCAAGTDRPPRGDRLDRLVMGLLGAGPVDAALSGARVIAGGEQALFVRNAGETARGGLAPLVLTPGRPAVWDGRFEAVADRPGLTLRALKGLAGRLPKPERDRLRAIAAAARPSLPVMVNGASTMTCPILAEGLVCVRPLAGLRLLAAAGAVATESQAAALAHGAEAPLVLF